MISPINQKNNKYIWKILFILVIIILIIIFYSIFNNKNLNTFEKFDNNNLKKNNNIKLGIQTVFIANENLPFLREWLLYNFELGFDKIYLYDNTGSIGEVGNNKINKYLFNFTKIIKLSPEQVKEELHKILDDFKGKVEYVIWQPKNEKGEIYYAQDDAIRDYIKKFGVEMNMTAYIDIDEFIVSPDNIKLKDYIIHNVSNKNITNFKIIQKKMMDRFCNKNKGIVVNITNSIVDLDTNGWAGKCIVSNKSINLDEKLNIHHLPIKDGNELDVPENIFRFNHYNVNKKQINWMTDFFTKKSPDEFKYGKDELLKNNNFNIQTKCNGKCSNDTNYIDYDEINKYYNELCVVNWN